MMFRSIVAPMTLALSLALGLAATPVLAGGDGNGAAAPAGEHAKDKKEKKEKKDKAHFPLKADEFQKIVDKRIEKVRERVGKVLEKSGASAEVREKALKDFDAAVVKVREAAKNAGSDGSVTREEAKTVRDLAKSLKKELREKYAPKKEEDVAGEKKEKKNHAEGRGNGRGHGKKDENKGKARDL